MFTSPYDRPVDLLVRVSFNRLVVGGTKVKEHLGQFDWAVHYEVDIKHDRSRKNNKVELSIRCAKLELPKPDSIIERGLKYPKSVTVNVVEVLKREPEEGLKPVHWHLYTAHPVDDLTTAIQVVKWYTQRWWVEDFFRLTKKQGFELEKSNLRTGIALKRLIHLVYKEALQVMTLR